MTNTSTSQAIYLLGDESTAERLDILVAKAAEHGAVIGKTFAFGPGEAACADDLSTVDAVVEALGRAIANAARSGCPGGRIWRASSICAR